MCKTEKEKLYTVPVAAAAAANTTNDPRRPYTPSSRVASSQPDSSLTCPAAPQLTFPIITASSPTEYHDVFSNIFCLFGDFIKFHGLK
ncbi:hypothetical protein E2C01_001123 [Portunus trituberculatus]|uniref:Uncharacterized protein n=1 Tax=Portunus trituberculatus TaxID=210409 RepID=A0A5B7CJM2_PORTR|nr:hypothetical protein [Portunus trituberculatus]